MDLQEAIFDQEAVREELRTHKLKVAKLEEQNLETSKIRQELKDIRIMVHVEVDETQKFGTQLQKILKDVTRDFASTEMVWKKNLRRTSMIGRSYQRHEQDLKSLVMLRSIDH